MVHGDKGKAMIPIIDIDTVRIENFIDLNIIEYLKSKEDLHARDLKFSLCDKLHAVRLSRLWHSRLPNTQLGPWRFAFKASHSGVTYAIALWNNPSARMLPNHWLEMRRFACGPDAPKNTASRFLSWMVKYFRMNCPEAEKCISYQDTSVHSGSIYKAAGWKTGFITKARVRDRSKLRVGTNRLYRTNMNGIEVDSSEKIRWEKLL